MKKQNRSDFRGIICPQLRYDLIFNFNCFKDLSELYILVEVEIYSIAIPSSQNKRKHRYIKEISLQGSVITNLHKANIKKINKTTKL